MCGFEMLSTNLSVGKTLPSKARVTRDKVTWITICAKKLCLKDNTISTAIQAELLSLAFSGHFVPSYARFHSVLPYRHENVDGIIGQV
jgi:hypothetical protein